MNNNGTMDFEARLRLDQLDRDLQALQNSFKESAEKAKTELKGIATESNAISSEISNLKTQMLGFLTIGGATMLAQKIFAVRSEFQQLESAFTTMLQSKAKADQLMNELTTLAATTPFGLQEVAEGAKRLLAFQIPAQEVNKTLRQMGDVAAGLGVPMGQLIHIYGQVKAQGKLMTNDLYQFMNAGIPIIAELSKVMKISEQDVKELVSQGKVGFAEIQQVFQNLTQQGGLFYNMMEGQSKTLGGQLSNLQDNISQMFNELGKSSEGLFSGAIQGANFLVENYQKVGKTIAGLVAVYGTYKTALMVNLVLTQGLSAAAQKDALAKGIQTIATKAQTLAQWKLNAAMLANPWGIVLGAIVAVGAALWAMHDSTTASERALNRLNAEKEQAIKNEQEYKSKMEEAISTATNQALADTERIKALNLLKAEYPNIFAQYDIEKLKLADILQIKQQIAEEDAKRKNQKNAKSYEQSKADLEEFSKGIVKSPYKNGRNSFKIDTKVNAELEKELSEEFGKAWRHQWTEVQTYLQKKLQETKKEVKGDKVSSWQKTLEGQSVEDLQEQIAHRKRLINDLQQQEKEGKKWASHGVEMQGDWFAFDQKELSAQVSMLENQIEKIKTQKKSYLEWEKQYAQELAEAQKELSEVSRLTGLSNIEMQKKIDEAKTKVEAKQKQLDNHRLEKGASRTGKKTNQTKNFDPEAFARETQRKAFDNELLAQRQQIDQMAEGFHKEKAQIELHYKEKAEAIKRGAEDALFALEKEKKDSQGKMSAETFEARKGEILKNEDISHQINLQTKTQQEQKLLENLLGQYEDYEAQKNKITQKYAQERQILEEQISQASTSEEKEKYQKALAQLQKQQAEEWLKLEISSQDASSAIAQLFGDMSQKSVQDLIALQQAGEKAFEALKQGGNLSAESLKAIEDKLKSNKELIRSLSPLFKQIATDFKTLSSKNASLEDKERAFNGIFDNIQKSNQALSAFGDALKSLGSDSLSQIANVLGDITQRSQGVASALKSVGVGAVASMGIGAGVGILTSVFSQISQAKEQERQREAEFQRKQIEHEKQLKDLQHQRLLEMKQFSNVFVSNKIGRHIEQLNYYKNKQKELATQAQQIQNGRVFSHYEKKGKWFSGGLSIYKTETTAIYKSFKEKYGQLIDEVGNLNLELIEKLNPNSRDFANTLTFNIGKNPEFIKGNKDLIASLKELKAQAEETKAKLEEYVQESFGALGSGFTDSIISAVEKGTNAFDTFGDTVSQVMKNLLKQVLVTDQIKAKFDDFNQEMTKIYAKNMGADPTQVFAQVKEHTLKFVNGVLKPEIEKGEALTKALFDELEKEGIKMYDENAVSRQAKEKGFARMSQDSADELNGQFRLLTQLSAEIKATIMQIASEVSASFKALQAQSAQQLKHLAGIETNTFTLHEIKKDISAMKNTFADIETKGIKIR